MSSLQFSTVAQTIKRLEDNDFGPGYIDKLGKFGDLRGIKDILDGRSEIKPINHLLVIDRSNKFDPETFIGSGWKIEEEDERSVALYEIDLSKVQFVNMLKDGETSIIGRRQLNRLKQAEYICLDAKVFQTLWGNRKLIPEAWKEKINGNTRYIFFDGTVLKHPNGSHYVFCLYWEGGKWKWTWIWLGNSWSANDPSAVLAK